LLANEILASESLELLAPVELAAVCFRAVHPRWMGDLDTFNAELLRKVNARGNIYLSNATISNRIALRACFTNHRTTEADVEEVVRSVLDAASEF
jgi:aromatic-L-amino-acid/L-tryptophan decarboxylase